MRRADFVFDSLTQAGMNRQLVERIQTAIKSGDVQGLARRFLGGGGGGFGGRPPADRWVERPGESSAPRRQASEGERPEEADTEGGEPQLDQNQFQDILRLLRPPGARGRGGRFGLAYGTYSPGSGQGQASMVETGDYLVSLKVGDRTLHRVLRVIRTTDGAGGGFFAGDEER
jgi:hypothetical protein